MSLEILTRYDEIRRNVVGHQTPNVEAADGSWVARDANGNASVPVAGSQAAQIVILGNEAGRPDSSGSATITVAYGVARFAVDATDIRAIDVTGLSVGSAMQVGTPEAGQVGAKLVVKAAGDAVAVVESITPTRVVFRTLQ